MNLNWTSLRHYIALILIAASLAFSAAIWSTPPSLGYLSIFLSSGFALIMTLSWVVTFSKSTAGKILIALNTSVCFLSIGLLFKESGGFENYQHSINIFGNITASIMTLVLGTINFKKLK